MESVEGLRKERGSRMLRDITVLIIDDSATSCHVMETILHSEGYHVKCVGDGREGLMTVIRELPSCVILDVVLPGMSGYEVCRHLRSNDILQGLPIIMVSTKSTPLDRAWALRQGATHYLVKPFDDGALAQLVKEATATYEPPVHQAPVRQPRTAYTSWQAPIIEQNVPTDRSPVEEGWSAERYQTYGKLPAYSSSSSTASTDVPLAHLSPLHKLIPLRVQSTDYHRNMSPSFLSASSDAARKLYEAIDGRNDIETLCSITELSREDVMRGLRSLLMQQRIRLREPGSSVIHSSRFGFEHR